MLKKIWWLLIFLPACAALQEYPRRSELTLITEVQEAPARSVSATLILHGGNKDIVQEFEHTFQFVMDKSGLSTRR